MTSPGRARAHLTVLHGSGLPADREDRPAGPAVAQITLGPGEWALTLPGEGTPREALLPARDLIRGLQSFHRAPAGKRCAIVRTQPGALASWIGPAVLHHSGAETVLYCPADQITVQAADALAALAARAAEFLRPAAAHAGCQVSVTRVGHRHLPV